jgi:hypothetical protein
MDLTAAIEHLQETATAGRDAIIEVGDGSGRRFIYDDAEKKYIELDRFVKQDGYVSTVESFAELVMEHAKRNERATGKNMTVTFTSSGATFSPDDNDRRDIFTYRRVLSQQWEALKQILGKPMSHKALIRTLQALSPSIVNYQIIFASFQRLAISKDVKLVSEPILNADGHSGNSYAVNLSIKGAVAGETTLPANIEMRLQYARGSSAKYDVPVEVDLTENDGTPVITLFAPTLDAVADQAVLDEMEYFEEQTSTLTDLLNVVNF